MLAFPSFEDISEAISSGTLIDCPVTIQSLKRAIDIYGIQDNILKEKQHIRPRHMIRLSTMQLTCCGTTRNFRKIGLQSSLLNCDYTLQLLQHVSTRCNQRLHCNDVCVCFYYSNNTQYKRLHSRLTV